MPHELTQRTPGCSGGLRGRIGLRRTATSAVALALIATALPASVAGAETAPAETMPAGVVEVVALVEEPDGSLEVTTEVVPAAVADEVVAELEGAPDVVAAEVAGSWAPLGDATPAATNDPYRSVQWQLNSTRADLVGDADRNGQDVVVAVLDTGVQANHPDLTGRVLPGYDFINEVATSSDPNGHGTAASGMITALSNNGTGIDAFVRNVKILPGTVCATYCYWDDVAQGVIWAVDSGADVINLSLGGAGSSSVMESAVQYAETNGVVVVASAGNEGDAANPVMYPAALPTVLGVGAVREGDLPTTWASYGSWVDLAAPGEDVASTYTSNGYVYLDGTSFSGPMVAAAAALVRRHLPGLSPTSVRQLLVDAARDVHTPGWDPQTGAGTLDLPLLLAEIASVGGGTETTTTTTTTTASTTTTTVASTPAPNAPYITGARAGQGRATISWYSGGGQVTGYRIERDGVGTVAEVAAGVTEATVTGLPDGVASTLRVRAMGPGGVSAASAGVSVTPQRFLPLPSSPAFAGQMFRDFLLRDGDAGGVAFVAGLIDAGLSGAQIADMFFLTDEFQGRISTLARLYFATYLRTPDFSGLDFWMRQRVAGQDLNWIAGFFTESPEFRSRYGNVGDLQYVDLVYRNVLGRSPDQAGYDYWIGQLQSRQIDRGRMLLLFSDSPEYRNNTAGVVDTALAYFGLLRRMPSEAELAAWSGQVASGGRVTLLGELLHSAEYDARS
jgi:subtilisin family serine protease